MAAGVALDSRRSCLLPRWHTVAFCVSEKSADRRARALCDELAFQAEARARAEDTRRAAEVGKVGGREPRYAMPEGVPEGSGSKLCGEWDLLFP